MAEEISVQVNTCAAKRLTKRKLPPDKGWEREKLDVMRHIIHAKEIYIPECRRALIDAKQVIAEAVHKDNYWSSGLPKDLTRWTRTENWLGKNMMDKLQWN